MHAKHYPGTDRNPEKGPRECRSIPKGTQVSSQVKWQGPVLDHCHLLNEQLQVQRG